MSCYEMASLKFSEILYNNEIHSWHKLQYFVKTLESLKRRMGEIRESFKLNVGNPGNQYPCDRREAAGQGQVPEQWCGKSLNRTRSGLGTWLSRKQQNKSPEAGSPSRQDRSAIPRVRNHSVVERALGHLVSASQPRFQPHLRVDGNCSFGGGDFWLSVAGRTRAPQNMDVSSSSPMHVSLHSKRGFADVLNVGCWGQRGRSRGPKIAPPSSGEGGREAQQRREESWVRGSPQGTTGGTGTDWAQHAPKLGKPRKLVLPTPPKGHLGFHPVKPISWTEVAGLGSFKPLNLC